MDFKILFARRFLFLIVMFSTANTFSQCFEIQSILVDACGGADEGRNEMVRFKVGSTALNIASLSAVWPNNSWQGVIQNTITASKAAQLNADILAAGGCGQILEPPGGIIPPNATVILVTSFNMSTAVNPFGALSETIYMIFHNNPSTSVGHFSNYTTIPPNNRTFSMTFGAGCSDLVVYDKSLLLRQNGTPGAEDGATVDFTPAGVATYSNSGCKAPTPPFTVDAGPSTLIACAGAIITLNGTAIGQQSLLWSSPTGTFSSPATESTNYTIPSTAGGTTIVLTLEAANNCGQKITDTVNLTVTANTTPDFATALTLCALDTPPILAATSPNGISGTWNPVVISTTANANYTFTPNAGQCALPVTLAVAITPQKTPDFTTTLTLCALDTPPILAATSPNGISGTWNPAVISTTASANYTFTPNAGQCAVPVTLAVTITPQKTPDFATTLTLCALDTPPVLAATSPNGISGTWNPAVISTTANANYTFTPNAGQCAMPVTLAVTIPVLSFSIKQECIDNSYLIKAVPNSNLAASDYTYAWFNTNGDEVAYNTSTFNFTEYLKNLNNKPLKPLQFKVKIGYGSCEIEETFGVENSLCGIQNAVSPNGDGINDDFNLSSFNVNNLSIFNRYGREVYDFRGQYIDEWHGQWKEGNKLPSGTYFYIISSENGDKKAGWVFLTY